MKVVLVLLAVVGVALGALGTFKCHQGADATAAAAAAACEQIDDGSGNDIDVAACGSPVIAEYTGKPTGEYKCGACDANTATSCVECTEDSCNAPVATFEYECAVVTWDAAATPAAFTEGETKTKCQASKDEDDLKICNTNGAKATNDGATQYVQTGDGCGPCDAAKKTAEVCAEYNSAATITAFLLPVVALFYTLF